MGPVRAAALGALDSVDPDSVDPDSADLARVGLDQVDQEQEDPELATSAQGNRAARVQPGLAEARERQAVGVTRHPESEPRARRAPAPVQWPSKPA